ncbi:MAG: tetratricopeptide repeat protein [Chthoniobacteraceae bacterium]
MRFLRHLLPLLLVTATGSFAAEVKYSQEFLKKVQEAVTDYETGKLDDAMKAIDDAEKIKPGVPDVLNLRGAIFFDQGKYDDATKWFKQALKRDPKFLASRINLADIDFRKGSYETARDSYNSILVDSPKNELLLYRVFLTYLLQKDDKNAQTALDAIPFPGDTPAHYFANGAWEYAHGHPQEASSYFNPGLSIFSVERCKPFIEPLVFLGWIKPGASATPSPAFPSPTAPPL